MSSNAKKNPSKQVPRGMTKIIENLYKPNKTEIKIVQKYAKNKNKYTISRMIKELSALNLRAPPKLIIADVGGSYYFPRTKTIVLEKKLSTITTLHELAHHFFGKSETKAKQYSIGLFKASFPNEYKKLKWKGNMLIKQYE